MFKQIAQHSDSVELVRAVDATTVVNQVTLLDHAQAQLDPDKWQAVWEVAWEEAWVVALRSPLVADSVGPLAEVSQVVLVLLHATSVADRTTSLVIAKLKQ